MAANTNLESLSIPELQTLIAAAQKALTSKVNAERAELQKKLQELDAISSGVAQTAPRARNSPQAQYRGPDGQEWSGRGGIPRWARDLGITDKAGMEKYKIA